jgi:hypothetical protein
LNTWLSLVVLVEMVVFMGPEAVLVGSVQEPVYQYQRELHIL